MQRFIRTGTKALLFILAGLMFCLLLLGPAAPSYAKGEAGRGIWIGGSGGEAAKERMRLYSSYYAVVIGCADYNNGWPALPNPKQDVKEVAAALEKMDFEVRLVIDPDGDALRREINSLVAGPGQDPELAILLYFAGHGYTLTQADGAKLGYIVPIDAPDPKKNLAGFLERAVSMRYIEQISTSILAKHVLMSFDSCFSGAIFSLVRAMPSQFIREQVAKPVRTFLTAGDENEQVPDESVFKTVFIQALAESYADSNGDGYITGQELGAYIQESVVNYSEGAQHPQFGKIRNPKLDKGDFVFVIKVREPQPQQVASLPRSQPEQPAIVVEESSAAVGDLAYTSNLDAVAFELLGRTFQTRRGKWLTIRNLPIGGYTLQIQHAGCLPWQQEVDIKVGETTKVVIWLEKERQEPEQKPQQAAAEQKPEAAVPSVAAPPEAQPPAAGKPLEAVAPVQEEMVKPPLQELTTAEEKPRPAAPSLAVELPVDAHVSLESPLPATPPVPREEAEPPRGEATQADGKPEAAAEKPASTDEASRRRAHLDGLLAKAAKAYGGNRLTTPAGKSALHYYRQVLAVEKENPQVCKGILAIAGKYLLQADEALGKQQFGAAESHLAKAKTVLKEIPPQVPQEHAAELARIKSDFEQLQLKTSRMKAEAKAKPTPQASQPAKPVQATPPKKPGILKEEFTTGSKETKSQTQTQSGKSKATMTPKILKEKLY